jgi:two-component sensor histidine kinase
VLANVQATVSLSRSNTPEGLKQAIEGRLRALANVHSLFVQSRWIGAELSAVASQELAPYFTSSESRVRVGGPPVFLKPDVAQAIAVTLHELATNAAKYGALSDSDGQVDLKWSQETDGRLMLIWRETGGPAVQPPTRKGFGGRVIEEMIAQLKGKTRLEWCREGLVCEITFHV